MSQKDNDMSELVLAIFVIIAVCGLIAIGFVLLGGIATIGFISGVFVGLKNFFKVLFEAHSKLP